MKEPDRRPAHEVEQGIGQCCICGHHGHLQDEICVNCRWNDSWGPKILDLDNKAIVPSSDGGLVAPSPVGVCRGSNAPPTGG